MILFVMCMQVALDSFITTVFQATSYGASVPIAMDYVNNESHSTPIPLLCLPDGFSRKVSLYHDTQFSILL